MPGRFRRKNKRIATGVTNVLIAINRRDYPAVTFHLHSLKKFPRILATTETWFRFERDIEAALGGKTRLHRSVVESADNKVIAGVTLWTAR